MKTYDVKCPICGKVNQGLYLEETGGFLECSNCRSVVMVQVDEKDSVVPSYVIQPIGSPRERKAI